MPDAAAPKWLINARAAAAALSISARTLWSLTNRGDLPHVRCGRRVLYAPADLAAYIEARRVSGSVTSKP
jgi:excisionase family DNA binding protein